jgi:hypothetical protein
MICPKCGYEQPDGHEECLACGVIFAKAKPSLTSPAIKGEKQRPADDREEPEITLRQLLFPEPIEVNPIALAVKALLWIALVIWAFKFIFSPVAQNYAGQSVLHLVNLPFHEAGHILFRLFGRFMAVLGGTLMQLLVPLVCAGVLLIRTRDAFGASLALWWLAENFMDIAPYINDARDLNLILLGGVTGKEVADYHDWEFILGKLSLLRMDHALALLSQVAGSILMVTALVWAAVCLWIQMKTLSLFSDTK